MKSYSHTFQNTGGISLMIAGLISAIALCFHPDEFIPGSVLLNSWKPVHLALLVAFTLSVFGIVGIFSFLKDEVSLFNNAAYFFGLIGCTWSVSLVVIELFVLPGIASHDGTIVPLMNMMDPGTSLETLQQFFFGVISIWILGWILVGVSLLRSNKLPKYTGSIVIVASICIAVPTHFAGGLSGILHILFSLLFGGSWILLGNSIRKPQLSVTP